MGNLRGATVNTSFSLPISLLVAVLPPPWSHSASIIAIFRRYTNGYGPRGKASFPFKLLNSDSCGRNMFGNIYGPHKVILINRSDITYLFHRLHFELVGFYSISLCSSMAGNMIKQNLSIKWPQGQPPGARLCQPVWHGNSCSRSDSGSWYLVPGKASSQHFAKILKR